MTREKCIESANDIDCYINDINTNRAKRGGDNSHLYMLWENADKQLLQQLEEIKQIYLSVAKTIERRTT